MASNALKWCDDNGGGGGGGVIDATVVDGVDDAPGEVTIIGGKPTDGPDEDVGVTECLESCRALPANPCDPTCPVDDEDDDDGDDLLLLLFPTLDTSLAFDCESSRSLFPLSSFLRASAASSDFLCMPEGESL